MDELQYEQELSGDQKYSKLSINFYFEFIIE